MNNILGFPLPTNNPSIMNQILLPSLEYAQELRDVCTWGLLFNPPYTPQEIKDTVTKFKNYGFKVVYDYREIDRTDFDKGFVPVSWLRNEAARLIPDCSIYALIDDDMAFKPGTHLINKTGGLQYLEGIHYMLRYYNRCGLILFRNMRKSVYPHILRPVDITEPYYTGRGMFLRRVPDCLVTPIDSEWVKGGDEENIAAGARLSLGLYPAEYHATRVYHHEFRRTIKKSGQETYGWYKWEVIENNATKYIQDHFNSEFRGSQGVRGSGYRDDPNIVTQEDYISKGGLGSKEYLNYIQDYSKMSYHELMQSISNLYERVKNYDSKSN